SSEALEPSGLLAAIFLIFLVAEESWECVRRFCGRRAGPAAPGIPSLAPRLLAHKIQSPQEMEALHALTVLETCVNNCGERFHSEIAKFRFLNELIKVLSPKVGTL
uniref:VHS domain-containing protein n=1 Tax=Nothoprocta perdicaria TaxID=30464 RepID=A0A8C6ZPW6_NOTPE